jgi:hypothetical protein
VSDLDDRAVVEQVRGATNIVSLVGQYVQLRKAGTKMMGLCPFHGEKAPSFSVSEDRQMFYCFGCNRGGDVFKFLMMIENLEFPEALNQLAEKAGIELPRRSGGRPGASVSDRERARKIHRLAQDFYRRCLAETSEGRNNGCNGTPDNPCTQHKDHQLAQWRTKRIRALHQLFLLIPAGRPRSGFLRPPGRPNPWAARWAGKFRVPWVGKLLVNLH